MFGRSFRPTRSSRVLLTLVGGLSLAAVGTGCQSTIGGQTLPSAYYLRDDIQYFPAGPEFKLSRQVEALEEYKLRQLGVPDAAE
jgi:hypothetical protein